MPSLDMPVDAVRLAIAANFTADPIRESLEYWFDEVGLAAAIRFAPYGQVIQSLLDQRGVLGGNRHDGRRCMNLVLLDLRPLTSVETETLVDALRASAARTSAPHLVVCCPYPTAGDGQPATPERASAMVGRAAAAVDDPAAALEARLSSAFAADPMVRVVTASELLERYPVADPYDAYGERTAQVPYTAECFTALATLVVRVMHAELTPRPKAIVVDADNTLWDGVVGEDGPGEVRVGPHRQALQRMLLAQHAMGRLLCVISKNLEADVLGVLAEHPDMLVRPEHLTATRINWRPKSANLVSIADELGFALDAFVVIDDSPTECAEINANCPGAITLRLPADAGEVVPFLNHCWPLDQPSLTSDDRQRAARYRDERDRQAAQREAPSLAEFIDSLGLVVECRPLRGADVARAAQLTQRVNQFNFTGARYSTADLAPLAARSDATGADATGSDATGSDATGADATVSDAAVSDAVVSDAVVPGGAAPEALMVEARDRFGEYGQVGLVLAAPDGDAYRVEAVLLSCRVLGRGVEHRVVAELGRRALACGLNTVILPYRPTARNRPALDFLDGLAARRQGDAFELPADRAASLRYTPATKPASEPDGADSEASVHTRRGVDASGWRPLSVDTVERIATELACPATVLALMARRAAEAGGWVEGRPVPTEDPTEQAIAQIWCELLEFPPTSVHDNFYELGGDSLQVVKIASRVRAELGVELPLDALFTERLTIAGLAAAARDWRLRQAGDQTLAELLTEISALSDDQVRALLEAES